MDSVIVYQDSLHLEIGLLAIFLILEFNKCILQTVASSFVSDDFARQDFPEPAEDQLQILIYHC
jgi:hypothetical protein